MTALPTLEGIEPVALDTEARGDAAKEPAVRTQAALVRALLDELHRRPASDAAAAALLEQLADEVERLARLLHLRESASSLVASEAARRA